MATGSPCPQRNRQSNRGSAVGGWTIFPVEVPFRRNRQPVPLAVVIKTDFSMSWVPSMSELTVVLVVSTSAIERS